MSSHKQYANEVLLTTFGVSLVMSCTFEAIIMFGLNQKRLLISRRKLPTPFLVLLILFCTWISELHATSQDVELSLAKSESAKLSNIDDWLIGVFGASDSINTIQYNNWDSQCVYTTTGSYRVEVSSLNGGNRLNLQSGSGDVMNYTIYTYVRRGSVYEMIGNTDSVFTLNNLSGSQSLTCADENVAGTNLWFTALVRQNDFNPAPPGVYRDVVTLLVSPE